MPHIIVEYADSLGDGAHIPELLQAMNKTLMAQNGVFPAGGTRSRAVKLTECRVADGKEDGASVHVTFKIAGGRTPGVKKATCDALFEAIKAHFAQASARHYLALSMGLTEFDEGGSYKHNNIHTRFHKTQRMLDTTIIQAIARRPHQAETDRRQIRQISLDYPDITIEDAYAIQREWVAMKLAAGRRLKGRKIGLTSRTTQQSSQIDESDYGALLNDMFFAGGSEIPISRFIVPRVEVELVFVLGKRLEGPEVTPFDAYDAVDHMVPALEIIDVHSQPIDPDSGRPREVFNMIVDNAADAGVVVGGRPIRMCDVDLRWVSTIFSRNAVIEGAGVTAGVLNHPANDAIWLANELAPHDVALEPGQVILGGSFIRPVPARAGNTFHCDYGPLGSIAYRFV